MKDEESNAGRDIDIRINNCLKFRPHHNRSIIITDNIWTLTTGYARLKYLYDMDYLIELL